MCEPFQENAGALTDVQSKVRGAVRGLWGALVGLVPSPGGAVHGHLCPPEDPVAPPVLAFPVPMARPVLLQDTAVRRTMTRRAARRAKTPLLLGSVPTSWPTSALSFRGATAPLPCGRSRVCSDGLSPGGALQGFPCRSQHVSAPAGLSQCSVPTAASFSCSPDGLQSGLSLPGLPRPRAESPVAQTSEKDAGFGTLGLGGRHSRIAGMGPFVFFLGKVPDGCDDGCDGRLLGLVRSFTPWGRGRFGEVTVKTRLHLT